MNDGFIVSWLLVMAAILYVTGWEQQVADGISLRRIVAFVVAATLLQLLRVPVSSVIYVTGSALLVIGTMLVWLIAASKPSTMLFMLFSSALTGFMWMWMRYIYTMDPVFIVIHPRWDGPLLAGIFAGLLMERFKSHCIVVVFSSLISLGALYLGPGAPPSPYLTVGSLSWWDGLAIALAAARLTGNVKKWIKESVLNFVESRSGEQGGSS